MSEQLSTAEEKSLQLMLVDTICTNSCGASMVGAMDATAAEAKLRRQHSEETKKASQRMREQSREQERARAVERLASQRRAKAQREREEQEQQMQAERSANYGVLWHARLNALTRGDVSEEMCHSRRALDKLVLPPSAKTQLFEEQGAQRNGPIFLKVHEPASGETCYCGVLGFDAPEGQVLLPQWAQANLGGIRRAVRGGRDWQALPANTAVNVKYTSLPKGKRCSLQPVSPNFQQDVDNPKDVLEQQLNTMSCLAEGEVIQLRGNGHRLIVKSVEPSPAASLMDTDLEVVVEYSAIAEAEQHAMQPRSANAFVFEEAQVNLGNTSGQQENQQLSSWVALKDIQAETRDGSAERHCHVGTWSRNEPQTDERRNALLQALPPEPAKAYNTVSVQFRFADGSRTVRRFTQQEYVSTLAQFAAAQSRQKLDPADVRLSAGYPRRELNKQHTLADEGLIRGNEAVLVDC